MAFGSLFFATPALADEPVAPTEPVVVVVTTEGGDDSSYQVPLTTTVMFDGVVYDSVYATTNSVITFGRPDGTYWDFPRTPSISLYSMDWVVYPQARGDEHLIIRASDGGFQVDISARPIWLQNPSVEVTNINIVAAINTDGTVSISYSLTGPSYDGQTRTGVRLTDGTIVTLEQYGIVQVEQPPVLEPEPVVPTPTPTAEPTAEPTPTPTPEPTVEPTPEPTITPEPILLPYIPEGATLLSEGSSIQVIAPEGQVIQSITAWYGDPDNATRGVDVSSTLTELASGQTSVTIDSDNRYGDPAGGTVKVLIFVVAYVPAPEPTPTPSPTPTPTETPVIIEPTPVVTPEPVVTPDPIPTEEPTVEPTPEPTVDPTPTPTPTEKPTPAPTQSQEPAPKPTTPVIQPLPEPKPPTAPEVQPKPELSVKEAVAEIATLSKIKPESLTETQAEELKSAAVTVLDTAIQGSAEYAQALEALAIVAQADDIELPAELAAIPGAAAVLDALNALGNIGADMSPKQRKESENVVVSAIVVGQVAQMATAAAASAAAGSSSSGSSGPRRRK